MAGKSLYKLNPLTADGEADLDEDGLPNLREFRASTDPTTRIAMETSSLTAMR